MKLQQSAYSSRRRVACCGNIITTSKLIFTRGVLMKEIDHRGVIIGMSSPLQNNSKGSGMLKSPALPTNYVPLKYLNLS